MDSTKPLLSICIPSNGAADLVVPVLESIYSQGVDNDLFEVIVSDNGPDDKLRDAVAVFQYPNFHYYRSDKSGFLNQIDAFLFATGQFRRIVNHKRVLLPGSIMEMIDIVKRYADGKPLIYFSEGNVSKLERGITEYTSLDGFVGDLGIFVSWSGGTGIWDIDIPLIQADEADEWFPHMSMMFGPRDHNKYVLCNKALSKELTSFDKGGYNPFKVFGVNLIGLMDGLRRDGRLSDPAFELFKKDVFEFLVQDYLTLVILPNKYHFDVNDIEECVSVNYGKHQYKRMVILAWLRVPKAYMESADSAIKLAFRNARSKIRAYIKSRP